MEASMTRDSLIDYYPSDNQNLCAAYPVGTTQKKVKVIRKLHKLLHVTWINHKIDW